MSSDYFDDDLDLDVDAFDQVVSNAQTHTASTRAGPSQATAQQLARPAIASYKQKTLFGGDVQVKGTPPASKDALPVASQPAKAVATKRWDRLKFADALPRTGGARGKGKGKARARKSGPLEEEEEEEVVLEDEVGDADMDAMYEAAKEAAGRPPPPMKLQPDREAARKWVYSINKPKRKYQYDIVHKALYNNCLVSLPTGLGKTFIAAVVMLNFYRWYPQGKILFLAPTRPLVQQQIEACHSIAGIPSRDCVALTGMIPAPRRSLAWMQKRVIFSTPQTVENDLKRGRLEPSNVICIVVDEAHRATGGYAYCEVIRLMMQFNPHFRVLALTATPGNDAERVQSVIDSLHIGAIEVRTEDAMDIRPYTKEKKITLVVVPLDQELISIRDRWASLMQPLVAQTKHLFFGITDPVYIAPFTINSAQKHVSKEQQYLRPIISVLHKMATAMSRLLEHSIPWAGEKMKELRQENFKAARGVCEKGVYKDLLRDVEKMQRGPFFSAHPKMDKLKALALEFFLEAQEQKRTAKLMVFCHFREVVEDIVSFLNRESPLIRASTFVGQGKDNKGRTGMNQKQQQEVIQKLKANELNVLVATSIGEEGLDIGALDCIICYDAQASPLRTLQRIGRTGRNEDGRVVVLMAEGREERNWGKAQDRYEHVQNALIGGGKRFELFADCERLIPDGIKPACEEREIPVQQYIVEQVEIAEAEENRKGKGKSKATKRKRDTAEDLPANALVGFVTAKEVKPPKTKEESVLERAQAALLTDEQSLELDRHWARRVSLATNLPPVDFSNFEVPMRPGRPSTAGSKSSKRALPSGQLGATLALASDWVRDGTQYDTWKDDHSRRFDERLVNWWETEKRGSGATVPRAPCVEARDPVRLRFRLAPVQESPEWPQPTAAKQLEQQLFDSQPNDLDWDFASPGRDAAARLPEAKFPIAQVVNEGSGDPSPKLPSSKPQGPVRVPSFKPPSLVRTASTTSGSCVKLSRPPAKRVPGVSANVRMPKPSDPDNVLSSSDESTRPQIQRPEGIMVEDSEYEELPDACWLPTGSSNISCCALATPKGEAETRASGTTSSGRKPKPPASAARVDLGVVAATGDTTYDMSDVWDDDVLAVLDEVEHQAAMKVGALPPRCDPEAEDIDPFEQEVSSPGPLWARTSMDEALDEEQLTTCGDRLLDGLDDSPAPVFKMPQKPKRRVMQESLEGIATQMPIGPGRLRRGKRAGCVVPEDQASDSEGARSGEPTKRLRRARASGEADRPARAGPSRPDETDRGRMLKEKRGDRWAKKTGFFEMEASEASGSGSSDGERGHQRRRDKTHKRLSSSPEISSEDSDDRAFVARSSSASPDKSNIDMQAFYRDSLLSQNPAFAHGPRRPGDNRWRLPPALARDPARYMDTPQSRRGREAEEGSDWSVGSFVVEDDHIDWEEGASGALGEASVCADTSDL